MLLYQIPQGKPEVTSFSEIQLMTEKQIAAIIKDSIAKNAAPGTPEHH